MKYYAVFEESTHFTTNFYTLTSLKNFLKSMEDISKIVEMKFKIATVTAPGKDCTMDLKIGKYYKICSIDVNDCKYYFVSRIKKGGSKWTFDNIEQTISMFNYLERCTEKVRKNK